MSLRQSLATHKTQQPPVPDEPAVKARENVRVRVVQLRPMQKGTMLAFADLMLVLPGEIGIQLNDCVVHERDEQSWVNLPSKQYQKRDGTTNYAPLVDMDAATKKAFQVAAIAAITKEVESKSDSARK